MGNGILLAVPKDLVASLKVISCKQRNMVGLTTNQNMTSREDRKEGIPES